jgi:ABC-type phosphate transport system auxiliary subunit
MIRETATLYEEIRALLDDPSGAEEDGFLDRLEHTLTDGYARALALEAERVRLERRMGELAGGLHEASGDGHAAELATVARRLADTDAELTQLRGVLDSLRDRARAVRAA